MIRRSSRLLLEVLAAVLAGFVVLTGLAAWRLSQDEPIRLTFLTPYLEQALTPDSGSFKVAIDDTVVTWGGWERTLDLRATRVRILESDGRTIASIPSLSLTLSLRALVIHQLVAPAAIEIFEPRIFLVREESGRFRFVHAAPEDPSAAGDESSPVLVQLLETLLAPPDPTLATGYLVQANVTSGQLTFVDRKAKATWRAPVANIALRRDAKGIVGQLDLAVERLGDPARFNAALTYDSTAQTLTLSGDFAGVQAGALSQIDPALARFGGADLLLGGKLTSTIDLEGRIGSTDFALTGGPGSWAMPGTLEAPLAIQRLALTANFDPASDRLSLTRGEVLLDGPRLLLTGNIDGVHAGVGSAAQMRIAGQLSAENMALAELPRYWPAKVKPNPRAWMVAHVTNGTVDRLDADIALVLPDGDPAAAVIERFGGTIEGRGITVHYLDPLPPVENAVATVRITQEGLAADFSAGQIGGVDITGGTLQIGGFQEPEQIVAVDGKLKGSLAQTLTVLDNERLGYAKKLGISPDGAAGDVTAELSFEFPAKKGLSFDEVRLAASAEIKNAAVEKAMLGQALSEGDISLKLDRQAMSMEGTAKLGATPIAFQWAENFGAADFIRKITASGVIGAEQRAALGFDYRPEIDGPIDAAVEYTRLPKKRSKVALKLKLAKASLEIPAVDWKKPAGIPGDAYIALDLVDERLRAISEFSVVAGDLVASGNAAFGKEDGRLNSLVFDQLRLKQTQLTGVTIGFAGPRVDVEVAGGEIDAKMILKRADDAEKREELPPFTLRADRLQRIRLADDRSLTDVSLALRHDGAYWDSIALDATLPEQKPLSVRYEPAGGNHKLTVTSPDAGATLRAFGLIDSVKGGRLSINGQTDDAAPDRPLTGKAEISEFRMVGASVLVRLLNAATLFGLVDMLSGEGFQFDGFESDFKKTAGRLDIGLARAHGPSIGITGTGYVDFDRNMVDIEGTVVPAYALNSIINEIPIIGFILTGGEGEGMFAGTYHATGPVDEPKFSVNPLAALAPGFLRGIFNIMDDSGQAPPVSALPKMGTNK